MGGKTDEERTVELLREFCDADGVSAAVSVNDTSGLVDAICFQTASQKRLFRASPEVIMVDTTHGTNKNYYKLFSILLDNVFGKGQYVQHSLVESEAMDNLTFCLNEFKESNRAWVNIRVVVRTRILKKREFWPKLFPMPGKFFANST
ncbi:hypothetical protein PR003_g22120 [Phytophthora rubi]|uniref:ZSWIM1/3 RNaseH-like domain-containing protein n=1 Tax=Phytophthora rubi TaxID=129364 RepID=A0A6A4DCC9_9STRA|nr:hypothetical protein PR003_g22120 [Phytophthora rubi]